MNEEIKENRNVAYALKNLYYLENTLSDVQAMETGLRGYSLSGRETFLSTYQTGKDSLASDIQKIHLLEVPDAGRETDRQKLYHLLNNKIDNLQLVLSIGKQQGTDSAVKYISSGSGEKLMDAIRVHVNSMENKDRLLLSEANFRSNEMAARTKWQFLLLAVAFFSVLVSNFITIRKDLAKRLEQDKLLRYNSSLIKSIRDPIIARDQNHIITSWNRYAEELYGWTAAEAIGKNCNELLTPNKIPDNTLEDEALKKTGSWKGELIHSAKNGKEILVEVSVSVIKDEDDKNTGTVAIISDITKRKEIESRLQQITSNLEMEVKQKVAELNNVFERITDAFIAVDKNWCYTYVNAKAAELHGKKAEDLIGRKMWDLYPQEIDGEFYKILHVAMQTMQPQKVQLYASQNHKWFEDIIYPSKDGLSVYYHDITDRKLAELQLEEAEEKFRNLVEASMVGVYIIQEEKLQYVNPCFADTFGFTKEELELQYRVMDLIIEEDRQMVAENIRRRLEEEAKSLNYEFRAYTKTGETIYVEVYGTRTLYKGKPAIIGMLVNTTEKKKSLQKLEESEKNLKISNERFLLVAEATNDAVWDWDIINDVIWGNEPFLNIMQTGTDEKITYTSFISRLHPDDTSSMMKNHRDALKNKRSSLNEEFRFKMVDGTYRTLYNRASILYDDNGRAFRLLGAMQDITAQKIAQKQLLLEKQLSDSIINSLPGIFYLYNQSGQFYRWNSNFETVSGYNAREISGLHPLDLFAGDDVELLKAKIQNVFLKGEDHVEANFKTKDGTLIPYYFTGMLINYEGETCLMGVGIDISERVQTQEQLIKSEENFRMLIEQASDGIFISDANGDYQVVNNSACMLTGYTREELLTKNIKDLLDESSTKNDPLKTEELSGGQIVISEKIMKRKDGSTFIGEISAKLLFDGRYQGIVRDVTARKRNEEILRDSEEKRRLIMNAALDAIITIDLDGRVTFWNPQAENIFGWEASEVYGKLLSDVIIPARLRNENDHGMIKYLNNQKNDALNKVIELSAVNRSNDEFPIELTVLPISQKNDAFFCVFIRDITKRKLAEEEIRISEHKYRLLFEQNPLPMWMMSLPEKNFIDVNQAAAEFYGYDKSEFKKMNIKDIRPDQKKEDASDIISTYKSGIHNTGVWEHRKKSGEIVKMILITHDIIYQGKHAKLVLANDVTEKIEAEEKLKNSYGELRELATHLQSVREAERAHMAREVHDELGQQLTGLKMDIAWIAKKMMGADPETKSRIDETLKLIDTTVRTVRRIATQLRPSILDDLGIVATLEWQSEEFQKRSGIECVFSSNVSSININTDIATGFFRIYQESLTNVSRHSQATRVDTTLLYKDNLLILNIADNGIGYNAAEIENKKTLGLLGMKERTLMMGGTYEVSSKPGSGTKVIIVVPIHI